MESASIKAHITQEGRLHLDLPVKTPPGSEVDVIVSIRLRTRFDSREAWRKHVKAIAGTVPDIERPFQYTLDPVQPI